MTSQGYKPVLSNARLNTASECDLKFYRTYAQRLRPTRESSYFTFGRIVHEVIEGFYGNQSALEADPETQLTKCLQSLDLKVESKLDKETFKALKTFQEQNAEALAQTHAQSNRPLTAPKMTKFYKENWAPQLEDFEKMVNSQARKRFERVLFRKGLTDIYEDNIKCIENFILFHNRRKPDLVLTELKIEPIEVGFGWTKGGKIDRLELWGDEIEVWDYKTGVKIWTRTQVANEDQFIWYAKAAKHIFPDHAVRSVGVANLLKGTDTTHAPNDDDYSRFQNRLDGKIKRHDALTNYYNEAIENDAEPAFFNVPAGRDSEKCKNCDYAVEPDPERRCPFYRIYEEGES